MGNVGVERVVWSQFVLIPCVSVYKDTPPPLIGTKTEIPQPFHTVCRHFEKDFTSQKQKNVLRDGVKKVGIFWNIS